MSRPKCLHAGKYKNCLVLAISVTLAFWILQPSLGYQRIRICRTKLISLKSSNCPKIKTLHHCPTLQYEKPADENYRYCTLILIRGLGSRNLILGRVYRYLDLQQKVPDHIQIIIQIIFKGYYRLIKYFLNVKFKFFFLSFFYRDPTILGIFVVGF